jgi:hypothetical protein
MNRNKKPSNKDNGILFFPKFRIQKRLFLATRYTGYIWNAWKQIKGEFFFILKQKKKIYINICPETSV